MAVWAGMRGSDPVVEELPWLRALARRLAADDAEDLVQDTWVMAHRDQPRARGRGLRPWLATAMRNRLRSVRRSATARGRREEQVAPPLAEAPAADRALMEQDVVSILDEALATLSDEDRGLLRARFFDGQTAVEIAAARGMPAATVRTKVRRSLLRLREVLDARHGNDRQGWVAAVMAAPWAKASKGATTVASTKGIVAGVSVAAAVGLTWVWLGAKDDGATARAGQVQEEREATAAAARSAASAGDDAATAPTASDPAKGDADPRAADSPRGEAGLAHRGAAPAVGDPGAPPTTTQAPAERTRDCAINAAKHDCDFLDPDPAVVQDMAACGIVRYDFPAMFAQRDWTPQFEAQWLDLVGATESERKGILDAGAAYRTQLFTDLRTIGTELGLQPWDEDATLLDVVIEISVAVGDDGVAVASKRIAQENAGQLEPPETLDGRPVAERFVRRFTAVGDEFEAALAEVVGTARARELHAAQDGWPGVRAQTGARCPE